MGVVWDADKARALRAERGIEMAELANVIVDGRAIAVLENPSRPAQMIFVVLYRGYVHVVPFVIDGDTIILKTALPSRKFHKRFGRGS